MKKREYKKKYSYDNLEADMKRVYNEYYDKFNLTNIFDLREVARRMNVPSRTTLSKDELVLCMVDKALDGYNLRKMAEQKNNFLPQKILFENLKGRVRFKGEKAMLKDRNMSIIVDIPQTLVDEYLIEDGDLVEGNAAQEQDYVIMEEITRIRGQKVADIKAFGDLPIDLRKEELQLRLPDSLEKLKRVQIFKGDRILIVSKRLSVCDIMEKFTEDDVYELKLFVSQSPEVAAGIRDKAFFTALDFSDEAEKALVAEFLRKAKRYVQFGNDVMATVFDLDMIQDKNQIREIFGAGRVLEKGSFTVLAVVRETNDWLERAATKVIELD